MQMRHSDSKMCHHTSDERAVNDRHLETFYRTKEGMQNDLKKRPEKCVDFFFTRVEFKLLPNKIFHTLGFELRNAIAGNI